MNKDIMQKWVDRLRELDGKDMQTTGVLKNQQGQMCCLGVLCEIAVEEGVIEPAVYDSNNIAYAYPAAEGDPAAVQKEGWWGVTPNIVAKWAGFPETATTAEVNNNPSIDGDFENSASSTETFSTWNDDYGKTFGEIADMIERAYL